ncbi:MAG TPA: DNA gyrase modulator, partial [Candidatus Acidoferrales bacterium]|nr:DNA gyrase modulator [Candidatus Acidoferrales bacterium]
MATNTQTVIEIDTELRELAASVVSRAVKAGATAAEAVVREGSEFSTVVRMGEVETLKESGSRAIGLRTFLGRRAASTYSSDFSAEGIQRLISSAIELARVTSEDIYSGIPEPDQLGSLQGDLKLYHDDVYSLPP